jgi:uncharacterized protein YgbK (DUF1537 family)
LSPLPHRPWGIIADDLTGATDTAAAFARAGFKTLVVLDRNTPPSATDVLVVSTGSRHDTPRVARRKAIAACRWLARHKARVLYKKMDSTLQGNIVSEVSAIRDAAGFASALVCSANPKQGRTIQHGRLIVRRALQEDVSEHFARQGLRKHACVHLPMAAAVLERALDASRFVLADAADERHLAFLVSTGVQHSPDVLLAGSAGMAAALANHLTRISRAGKLRPRLSKRPRVPAAKTPLPALILCGSNNPVTHAQLRTLVQRNAARETELGPHAIRAVRQMVLDGFSAIVHVPVHRRPDAELVRELRMLGPLLREHRLGSLLVSGGDTALLVVRWLKPSAITVTGEIVPGLASGWLVGGFAAGLRFCTKPGGFGERTSLLPAVAALGRSALFQRERGQNNAPAGRPPLRH